MEYIKEFEKPRPNKGARSLIYPLLMAASAGDFLLLLPWAQSLFIAVITLLLLVVSVAFAVLHWVSVFRSHPFSSDESGCAAKFSFLVAVLITTPYLLSVLAIIALNIAMILGVSP